jgi:hypothetical protein
MVVLHARCTRRSLTTAARTDAAQWAQQNPEESSAGAFPPWPLLVVLAARSTIARCADPLAREREAERRRSWAGSWVTSRRSTQRLRADRSAHVYTLCQSRQKIDFDNLHRSPGIRRCIGV